MKKLISTSLAFMLLICANVSQAQDLDPQIAGMRLKDMTIYLSVPYYGPYSYIRRSGPNQETSVDKGTGTIRHLTEIHGDDATWLRVGNTFTARYYSDTLSFVYDSANNRFTSLDYAYDNYSSRCYGGTSARISMSSTPIVIDPGKGLRVNWSGVNDWRQLVTSWSYYEDVDCPTPYHNSFTGSAHGDSLEGPIEFTFATASMSVPRELVNTHLRFRVSSSSLSLEFNIADRTRELTICDLLGRELLRATIPANMSGIEIPLHHIPRGALLIQLGGSTLKIVR
jgi:hypothetical protein